MRSAAPNKKMYQKLLAEVQIKLELYLEQKIDSLDLIDAINLAFAYQSLLTGHKGLK